MTRASTMPRPDACSLLCPAAMFAATGMFENPGSNFTMLRVLTLVSLTLVFAAAPARAQFWGAPLAPAPAARPQPPPKPPAAASVPAQPAKPQPSAQEQPTPYDHDLQRLSEILGALHFLRGICNSNEGQKWRTEAQALIEAEAPAGDRHDAMVASFNRGYRGFQQSYRTCTPAADVVVRRYLEEGARIARDITARYAN
jgi:uncharacterized protein (TIGR02301 family)